MHDSDQRTAAGRAHRRTAWGAIAAVARRLTAEDRGDVPGWVLVTLMTAGLPALTVTG